MLNAKELKVVVKTLSTRRAWLKKALEDKSIDEKVRAENIEALKLLDSSIQKLSASAKAAAPPPPSAKKAVSPFLKNEPRGPVPIAQARILVAEDNEDSATLLVDSLADMDIKQVELAKDGMEAFDKIKRAEKPFHIILCDWDMPELTGIQVFDKAKASNTLGYAHFVMVTAVSEAPRIKEALQRGIGDYIVKPVDIDKLEAKIKAALSGDEAK